MGFFGKTKKIIVFIVAFILGINLITLQARADWPIGPEIPTPAAVVIEVESGTIVYEKGSRDAHFPASITKVLTALVALENSSLDEIVTFSHYAVFSIEPGSSSIARDVDEKMTMEQCLYALLLESANECATAIAEHVAGSETAFAEMMNQKARELGCVNSHFVNAHGLHNDDHYTCAYDMALIARAAYLNPTFALITGTKTYTIPPTNKHEEPTFLNNHHNMFHYYNTQKYLYGNCVGGKTGYTSKALSTLVTYARKDDTTLAVVTMCSDGTAHYEDTRTLFDYFFNAMKKVNAKELVGSVEIANKKDISLLSAGDNPFYVDDNIGIYLPVSYDYNKLNANFVQSKEPGMEVGNIEFTYEEREVGNAKVMAAAINMYPFRSLEESESERPSFIKINIIKVLLVALAVIVLLVVLVVAYLKTSSVLTVLMRKRAEYRDPHKNMRRIKRRRKTRRRRSGRRTDFKF